MEHVLMPQRWVAVPARDPLDRWMVIDTWAECPPIEDGKSLTRLWEDRKEAERFAKSLGREDRP